MTNLCEYQGQPNAWTCIRCKKTVKTARPPQRHCPRVPMRDYQPPPADAPIAPESPARMFAADPITKAIATEATKPNPLPLGDIVSNVATTFGLDKAAKWVETWTGKDCGCEGRRQWLNAMGGALFGWKAKPLRVSFLTPTMGMGGAEATILNLARAWSDRKTVDVLCIAMTDGAQSWQPFIDAASASNTPVFGSDSLHGTLPNASRGVTRFPDPFEPIRRAAAADIVIHWGLPQIGELLERVGFRALSVSWSHGSIDYTRRITYAAAKGSTHFAAVSGPAAAAQPNDVTTRVLWNGIDLERLSTTTSREATRAAWGANPDDVLIGYVGRLSGEKNPLANAYAAAALQDRWPDRRVRPVWVGDGWEGDKYRALGRELAGDTGIWQPPTNRIGDTLAALDVFILASPGEGFSLSLTDAWAAGCPTVSTPVGAVPELQAKFGALTSLVPIDPTPEQLGEACAAALDRSNAKTVNRAKSVARKHFTAEAMAERWATWLKEISS